jgi:hypothetical protein
MDAILWILLPVLVALGSAILSYSMMRSRMEVAVARERETLAEANAKIRALEDGIPDKIRLAEETAQRRAFDQFLMDFRVEERRYLRESKSHLTQRRSMILQERLYFRNIPLSNWVEHEMQLSDDAAPELLDKSSVFSARALSSFTKERAATRSSLSGLQRVS